MIITENDVSDVPTMQEGGDGNPAMADAMRRVLSIGKNTSKSSVVLAKAKVLTKKQNKSKPEDPSFEIDTTGNDNSETLDVKLENNEDIKPDKALIKRKRIKRQEVAALGRLKPTALDREKERPLMKMATRGVIQLFNAVREQQKLINKKIEEVGPSETKKDKVLKSIDKKTFLDVLQGCAPSNTRVISEAEIKTEDEDENDKEPSWSVLRDDFMMGANLKDWDKKEEEEEEVSDSSEAKRKKK